MVTLTLMAVEVLPDVWRRLLVSHLNTYVTHEAIEKYLFMLRYPVRVTHKKDRETPVSVNLLTSFLYQKNKTEKEEKFSNRSLY